MYTLVKLQPKRSSHFVPKSWNLLSTLAAMQHFSLKKTQSSSETMDLGISWLPIFHRCLAKIIKLLNYKPKSGDEAGLANSMDNLAVTDTFDWIAAEVKTFSFVSGKTAFFKKKTFHPYSSFSYY